MSSINFFISIKFKKFLTFSFHYCIIFVVGTFSSVG